MKKQRSYRSCGKRNRARPWQSGSDESFIGTFRKECFNAEVLTNPTEARVVIEQNKQRATELNVNHEEYAEAYAKIHKLKIVEEFNDPAVSRADPIQDRPGFGQLLRYITGNGARIVLVENASRFARDLAVQIAGHDLLKDRGIELIPVDAPDHFTDETPTAVMVRQILGAVSEFEKSSLVQKLRKARERKKVKPAGARVGSSYRMR